MEYADVQLNMGERFKVAVAYLGDKVRIAMKEGSPIQFTEKCDEFEIVWFVCRIEKNTEGE